MFVWQSQDIAYNSNYDNIFCPWLIITQFVCMKSLKIPKGQSESVIRRRTDNVMAKRKRAKGQTMIYKTYT